MSAPHLATPRESMLMRLANVAADLEEPALASEALALAERVAEGRFYVACVGQFKRGKSSLLDALLGDSVLPIGILPVTAVPTIVRYGERPAARVRLRGRRWESISIDALGEYVSEAGNPANVRGVLAVEVFLPSPLLQEGMCLVDTPGVGSVIAENTEATVSFVPQVDAALIVIGADPPMSGEELALVEAVASNVRELILVLNKADRFSQEDGVVAAGFAASVLAARLKRPVGPVFHVSALERLAGQGPPRDWDALVAHLMALQSRSRATLVGAALRRGTVRVAERLLARVESDRFMLTRPMEESQRRIAALEAEAARIEGSLGDLAYLLEGEQARLSAVFSERRAAFLAQVKGGALAELAQQVRSVRACGPRLRSRAMQTADEIARSRMEPWVAAEQDAANEAFGRTVDRFVTLAREFIDRLAPMDEPMAGISPVDEIAVAIDPETRFYFQTLAHGHAEGDPFAFVLDLGRGILGLRQRIGRNAEAALVRLLERNATRVQNDLDERVSDSRRRLESRIRTLLGEALASARRSLERAAATRAEGAPAVAAELARLESLAGQIAECQGER